MNRKTLKTCLVSLARTPLTHLSRPAALRNLTIAPLLPAFCALPRSQSVSAGIARRGTKQVFNALAAALLLAAPLAHALESDRKQPIEIEADQGELDQKNRSTTFSGNVSIKQGTLNIRAASVHVVRSDDGQQTMKATGSPVRFGQTLDGGKGTVNGEASQVDYSSATNVVRLSGNAKVTRGGDKAEGAVITYNTRTEVYTVSGSKPAGGKGGKRVSVVIQPDSMGSRGK